MVNSGADGEMAVKLSPARNRVKGRKLIVIAGIILCLVLVLSLILIPQKEKINCQLTLIQATKLLKEKNYDKAYRLLSSDVSKCDNLAEGVKHNQKPYQVVEYNYQIAISAYYTKHSAEAKKYAQQSLDVYNSLQQNDKDKILWPSGLMLDMTDILKRNEYYDERDMW